MHFAAIVLSFVSLLPLSGCTLFPPREPPTALHDLGPGEHPAAPMKAAWSKVFVDAPEWLQDERIRYRLVYADPTRVRFYARDRWLAPPPALLAQRWSVAGGGHGYRLHIRLLDFEQVFDGPTHAWVILRFGATADLPERGQTVGERVFQLARPTPSADAAGAVTAFAALVDEAAHSIGAWLAQWPSNPEAPDPR